MRPQFETEIVCYPNGLANHYGTYEIRPHRSPRLQGGQFSPLRLTESPGHRTSDIGYRILETSVPPCTSPPHANPGGEEQSKSSSPPDANPGGEEQSKSSSPLPLTREVVRKIQPP